jgi:hypothetical protein
MSTPQRSHACSIVVDPSFGEILRRQTLVVLEVNHQHFEDVLDLSPQAQRALSVIYRDAFAVLDALGWAPGENATTITVPLTAGHVVQLRRRLDDLTHTNLDRLARRDRTTDPDEVAALDAQIAADGLGAQALGRLIATTPG